MSSSADAVLELRSHRNQVELLLALFAESAGVRQQVPAPEEICRRWFDDVYVPSNRYFDALKGAESGQACAEFRRHFSEDELLQLERFHQFLELRLNLLRKTETEPTAWLGSAAWRAVAQSARSTVELLRGGYCRDSFRVGSEIPAAEALPLPSGGKKGE